jgi:hypothetical protein
MVRPSIRHADPSFWRIVRHFPQSVKITRHPSKTHAKCVLLHRWLEGKAFLFYFPLFLFSFNCHSKRSWEANDESRQALGTSRGLSRLQLTSILHFSLFTPKVIAICIKKHEIMHGDGAASFNVIIKRSNRNSSSRSHFLITVNTQALQQQWSQGTRSCSKSLFKRPK